MDKELIVSLYEELKAALPELTNEDFNPITGSILLVDDSDGLGAYIEKWEYSKPIPKGFKLGK
jgi:hypothetical protein